MSLKIEVTGDNAKLYTPYNGDFVSAIKKIRGAHWDGKCWNIPAKAVEGAREIMRNVYGKDDTTLSEETVNVRLTFNDGWVETRADVNFCGKCLAHAYGRDSGGKAGDDVVYIHGAPDSGGSVKNWNSRVPRGSVVLVNNINKALFDAYISENPIGSDDSIHIEVLKSKSIDRNALVEEKERLLKRVAEIDELLGGAEKENYYE